MPLTGLPLLPGSCSRLTPLLALGSSALPLWPAVSAPVPRTVNSRASRLLQLPCWRLWTILGVAEVLPVSDAM